MTTYPNVKINLGLSILRKRPDGFHDLETLFVPYFGIRDRLEIDPAAGAESSIRIIGGNWDPQSDLCWKAYKLLQADFNLPPVDILLEKKAPVGAGLGSGSADAAFTLKMLSEMFSLGLDNEALAGYAASLGSDCAFFVYNEPMWGEGRGERLSPYAADFLDSYEIVVEFPQGVSVSTKEAYSAVLPRERMEQPPMPLRDALALPVEQWRDSLVNDFERSVFPLHPEIPALKQSLYNRGAIYASMSGSGSAVFGLFEK